jgi:hypothetical protein
MAQEFLQKLPSANENTCRPTITSYSYVRITIIEVHHLKVMTWSLFFVILTQNAIRNDQICLRCLHSKHEFCIVTVTLF